MFLRLIQKNSCGATIASRAICNCKSEIPRESAVIVMGKDNCNTHPKELGNTISCNIHPINIVTKKAGLLCS